MKHLGAAKHLHQSSESYVMMLTLTAEIPEGPSDTLWSVCHAFPEVSRRFLPNSIYSEVSQLDFERLVSAACELWSLCSQDS